MASMFNAAKHTPARIPLAGLVLSGILSVITIAVLVVCLVRRLLLLRNATWSRLPIVRWLIFAIYTDSLFFTITTAILEWGFGLNKTLAICTTSIYICLLFYLTTKMLIYYFLVEKVYIIRRVKTSRLQSKLYCFNCFGLLLPYAIIVILNFVYRIARFNTAGTCIIGMEDKVLMPLIVFDAAINFYLTMLFIIPLRGLYSYKNSPDSRLRTITLRTFIGSCGTLTSSIVNLSLLMVLHGEAAWICLMCCNADVLFSVLMLHWVTSKDAATETSDHSGPSKLDKVGGFVSKITNLSRKNVNGHELSRTGMSRAEFSMNGKGDEAWEFPLGVTTTEIRGGRPDSVDGTEHGRDSKSGINVKMNHTVSVQREDGGWTSPRDLRVIDVKEERSIGAVGITGGLAESANGRSRGTSTEDLVRKVHE